MTHAASRTRQRVARTPAVVVDASGARQAKRERVVGEEPLEIRIAHAGTVLATTATMRTPGADFALAAGLLHAEGVIAAADDVLAIRYCEDVERQEYNVVTVDLRGQPHRSLGERTLAATASCGVCGSAEIDELCERLSPVTSDLQVSAEVLVDLPDRLRAAQVLFDETGGLHAAGLFTAAGDLVAIHEDVGRHNALDKLLGEQLLAAALPAPERIVVLSGRVSFELVQKTAAAGIPLLAAVGAPSNLAIATADRLGITLAGFVRAGRATLYAHPDRVTG